MRIPSRPGARAPRGDEMSDDPREASLPPAPSADAYARVTVPGGAELYVRPTLPGVYPALAEEQARAERERPTVAPAVAVVKLRSERPARPTAPMPAAFTPSSALPFAARGLPPPPSPRVPPPPPSNPESAGDISSLAPLTQSARNLPAVAPPAARSGSFAVPAVAVGVAIALGFAAAMIGRGMRRDVATAAPPPPVVVVAAPLPAAPEPEAPAAASAVAADEAPSARPARAAKPAPAKPAASSVPRAKNRHFEVEE